MASVLTLKEAIEAAGVSKPTMLSWIETNKIRAKKVENTATPAGFVYEIPKTEIKKMESLKRPKGRPRNE